MTDIREKDLQKIQQALSGTYRQRDETPVGSGWEKRVMARIRSKETTISRFDFIALFEQYFWRLTPVAVMIMLVLGVVVYQQLDTFYDYETARVYMGSAFDNPLLSLMGSS
jgi:hypothetical protein